MNKIKKVLVSAVTVGVLVGGLGHVNAVSAKFVDVPDYNPFQQYINDLSNKGVVIGKGEGKFGPGDELTRAEFTKMMVNAFQLPLSTTPVKFSDSTGHWGATYIQTGVESGFIRGASDTTFAPNAPVRREEAATMVWRLLKKRGVKPTTENVTLNDQVDDFAVTSVKNVVAYKLYGVDVHDNLYQAQRTMLRQEAAALYDLAMKMQPATNDVVVAPTTNPNNLIDNGDGSQRLGNITMGGRIIQGNGIPKDQVDKDLALLQQVKLVFDGQSLTLSVPDTGQSNLWWAIDSDQVWEGSEARTVQLPNGKAFGISIFDHNTGHGHFGASVQYRDGKWLVIYDLGQ